MAIDTLMGLKISDEKIRNDLRRFYSGDRDASYGSHMHDIPLEGLSEYLLKHAGIFRDDYTIKQIFFYFTKQFLASPATPVRGAALQFFSGTDDKELIRAILTLIKAQDKAMEVTRERYEGVGVEILVPHFYGLVASLQNTANVLRDKPAVSSLAVEIDTILARHEIVQDSKFYGDDSMVILKPDVHDYDVFLAQGPIQNQLITDKLVFQKKIKGFYSNSSADLKRMLSLSLDAAPVSYLLYTLFSHGMVVKSRKRHNLPVTFAELNSDGVLDLRNARPLATPVDSDGTRFDFGYNKETNHILFCGAHSGGKTHRLRDIGLYHLCALASLPLPADVAIVPKIANLYSRFSLENRKSKNPSAGSLENEVRHTYELAAKMGPDDLALLDEFLDTAKPEIARHLAEPLLKMLGKSPAPLMIVYHAAPTLDPAIGYRFLCPEIKKDLEEDWHLEKRGNYVYREAPGTKSERYNPTFRFIEGYPTSELRNLTFLHARQMWQDLVNHRTDHFYD